MTESTQWPDVTGPTQWQPGGEPPSPAAGAPSGSPRKMRPGRAWYLLAVAVLLGGAAWLAAGLLGVKGQVDAFQRVPLPQGGQVSGGPHSATGWVNMIAVPSIVVVGGFYDSGLPFGLEFSGRPFTDGDLLGYAYAWEQGTHYRHPPVLVEQGLLPNAR